MSGAEETALLSIEGLQTWFSTEEGVAHAVDGVDLEIRAGQTVALVGESGCGKSVLALSIMGLLPMPPAIEAGGRIRFRGRDLRALGEEERRKLRGSEIAMVFQEPMTSLNPVLTVGEQVAEALRLHARLAPAAARAATIELFGRVGISDPQRRVDQYPHQLSGGLRQRVMIAMALSCRPSLLVADEPTTALDVTIQAQILDVLARVKADDGTAVLFISHDLGVVAQVADRVAVMYAGRIVEDAPAWALYATPRHPYTVGLFDSLPGAHAGGGRLRAIPGAVPDPLHLPSGCRFRDRCAFADPRCAAEEPLPLEVAPGHRVACHGVEEDRVPAPLRSADAGEMTRRVHEHLARLRREGGEE